MSDTAKKIENTKQGVDGDESVINGNDSNTKSRNTYTWAFRIKAVKRIIEEGQSIANVANDLGVHRSTLRRWKRNWEQEFGKKSIIPDHIEEPIITRAIDHWDDAAEDSENIVIDNNYNTHSENKSNPQEKTDNSFQIKSSGVTNNHPRISAEIHPETDVYKHQLDLQHFSNRNPSGTPPLQTAGSGHGHATLNEILGVLQESRWFIGRIILLMLLLAIFHIWLVKPVYRAEALLKVEEKARGTGVVVDRSQDFLGEEAIVSEEVEILKSRSVMADVVNDLNLDIKAKPEYFPLIGEAVARKNPFMINNQVKSINESPFYEWLNEKSPSIAENLESVFDTYQALKIKFYHWLESTDFVWGNEQINVEEMILPENYLGKIFTLVAGENGLYQIFNEEGKLLGEGKVGEPSEIPLSNGEFVLYVTDLKATPGKHFEIQKMPRITAISSLQKSVIVREKAGVIKSGLLGLTLEGTDKTQISVIINKIMDTYIRQNTDRKAEDSQKTLDFMEEQLSVLKASMNEAEQGLNSYRQQEGSVDLATESEVVLKRIVEVESEISRLSRNRQELIQRFKPKHPKIIALDSQIGTLRSELSKLNEKVKKLPDTQQQVLSMTRDVEVQSKLYSFLFNKIQEFKVKTAGSVGNLRIVDYASTAIEPVKPQPKIIIVAYLLLGLIFGVGLSFLRRAIHAKIHDPEIIEKQLGLPVHATIPQSQQQKKIAKPGLFKNSRHSILAVSDPDDPAIEGLRGLRASLYFSQFESRNNLILVTGPAPEVGKSFISVNYAAVLVSAGKRVLVIDADFRRGTIHEYLGRDQEHHDGLSDLITGDKNFDEVIRNTDMEGLDIIPTGKMPPNPSELLLHENFVTQLQKISSYYDFVIIDTPPVLAFSDASVIGRISGSTLLVVKSGMHTLRQLDHTVKQLNRAGVKLEGVVFNGLDTTNTAYGYGQNYGYSYSYYQKN